MVKGYRIGPNLHRKIARGAFGNAGKCLDRYRGGSGQDLDADPPGLRLGRGAIIELDSSEPDQVRILANNLPVAKGTVIVSGNRIAVE